MSDLSSPNNPYVSDAPVVAYVDEGVGRIRLNRPDKFNCLTLDVHRRIDAARLAFEAENSVRVVLIDAAGKHFCTGADLDEVKSRLDDETALEAFITTGMDSLRNLERSPLPVVVAVQGLCLAGGLELMMAADICFASQSARFGDQHAQFGLVPGWGGSQRLPRLIGLRSALDLMLSARWLDAGEAAARGLVNYVVPDDQLSSKAMEYCRTASTRSRAGLAEMKRLAREGVEKTFDEGLSLEKQAAVRALPGVDVREGLDAFGGRRQPRFS